MVLVVATLAFFVQSASSDDVLTDSQRSSFLEASTNLQTLCLQVGIIEKANATGETLPEDILQDAQAQLERVKTDVKTVVDVYGHHPDGKLELKSGEQERLRPSVESATRNLSSCLPEVAGPLDQVLAKHA